MQYNFGELKWTSTSLTISPDIRNSDDQNYQELIIHGTRKESETIPEGRICHSGFGTHVTCGNIKAFTGFYLDKNKITDMRTAIEDLGGPVFLYTPKKLIYLAY
ncbi:10659_t:CDS:1, partial [Racocetra fulgida]